MKKENKGRIDREMEEFKNPFKKISKSISKSVNKTVKKVSKIASNTAKGAKQATKTVSKIIAPPKKKTTSSPPQPKKYLLQSNNFNNDLYFGIFCNQNSGGYRNWDNQRLNTSGQDIISNNKVSNLQGCVSKCNQDKTCTSLHFKKKMDKNDSSNCTLFRSYPTQLVSDSKYQTQIKNQLSFNYNQLNSNQKTNVQKYCVQQYYQNKNPNKSFDIKNCLKGISTKSNKNYIDLDSQCIWSNIQSAGMGKTKSKMVLEKNPSLQNAKKNPFMDKYVKNWNEYHKNHKKYINIERDLEKYDPSFTSFNEQLEENTNELNQENRKTAEGTLATTALMKVENQLTLGGDRIERFENQEECSTCNFDLLNIFYILIICILVYFLFLKK